MKRVVLSILLIGVVLSGCSGKTEATTASAPIAQETQEIKAEQAESAVSNEEKEGETEKKPYEFINISAEDMHTTMNGYSTYMVHVINTSNDYLSGIIRAGSVNDDNTIIVAETTVFLNNLAPGDYASHTLLLPIGTELNLRFEEVWFKNSEKPEKSPVITDDNLYDYFYLTYVDYNDLTDNGSKKMINVDITNLTTQFLNATVKITAKDLQGNVLDEKVENTKNLEPQHSLTSILAIPITDDYTIEYEVQEYSFTDSPQA